MKIAILQPSYLPWIGYFDQMARVDRFVFLDDVQFTRRDWRNRNRIRTPQGSAWLTVPVLQKNRYQQSLQRTEIDPASSWKRKHCEAIRSNYSRAPYFDLYFPALESIYNRDYRFLTDLCYTGIEFLKKSFKIETPTFLSSNLNVGGSKGDRILEICEALQADDYLSGDAAENYLDPRAFEQRAMGLEFQHYQHPEYGQCFPGFIPYLSAIDLLFNCGEESLKILRGSD